MNNMIVSIVTPCYNSEKYLNNFLNSISNQSYKEIELIFVDDGSTDKSKEIFDEWRRKNESVLSKIIYIHQENKGQASAVNNGLKYVAGEYFMCCDSDDILLKDNIKRKVEILNDNTSIDLVFCACYEINSVTHERINTFRRTNSLNNFFDDLVLEKNVHFCPANYMIRMSSFDECYKDREIFVNRGGQNWQLLLPIVAKKNNVYIDEVLTLYLVSENSHSKDLKTLDEIYSRLDLHKEILTNVIKNNCGFSNEIINEYIYTIKQKYYIVKFKYAIKHNDKDKALMNLNNIKEKNKYLIIYIFFRIKIVNLYLKIRREKC